MESITIALTPVVSSNIAAFARPDPHTLVVQFKGRGDPDTEEELETRRSYTYKAEKPEDIDTLDGFEKAESKGSYFAKSIRPAFKGVQVGVVAPKGK